MPFSSPKKKGERNKANTDFSRSGNAEELKLIFNYKILEGLLRLF